MLDLKAIRCRALALRNMIPGHDDGEDPYVLHVYEIEDADGCRPIEHDSHECDYFPMESRVYVADHCLMATVPTNEGALMHDTAEAIAMAGADELALIAEVERLRAEQDRVWPDLHLALELLDDAFDMASAELYGAQGVNQAHRVIKAIVAGEEPMRPRRVVLTLPNFVKESDF